MYAHMSMSTVRMQNALSFASDSSSSTISRWVIPSPTYRIRTPWLLLLLLLSCFHASSTAAAASSSTTSRSLPLLPPSLLPPPPPPLVPWPLKLLLLLLVLVVPLLVDDGDGTTEDDDDDNEDADDEEEVCSCFSLCCLKYWSVPALINASARCSAGRRCAHAQSLYAATCLSLSNH